MSDRRQLALNLFTYPGGHHEAAWRYKGSAANRILDVSFYQELTQRAEAHKFDAIFFADGRRLLTTSATHSAFDSSRSRGLRRSPQSPSASFGVLDRSIAPVVLRWAAAASLGWIGAIYDRLRPAADAAASHRRRREHRSWQDNRRFPIVLVGGVSCRRKQVGLLSLRNGSLRRCSVPCCRAPGSTRS
jgi:hypothetical protein